MLKLKNRAHRTTTGLMNKRYLVFRALDFEIENYSSPNDIGIIVVDEASAIVRLDSGLRF